MNITNNFPELTIFFQPIISTSSRTLFGVEALLRGYDEDGRIVPAPELFGLCKTEKDLEYLSTRAIKIALDKFKSIQDEYPNVLLFLNIEPTLINKSWKNFKPILLENGIQNSKIVLEIKEEFIKNLDYLTEFSEYFRSKGFFIALDDFGSGCSNFERIKSIKPDVIKLDRSLMQDLHKDVVHQEIVKAIANMAHNLGSAILAEGIEDLADAVDARTRNITLFQGFLFDKPMPKLEELNYVDLIDNIESLVSKNTIDKMQLKKQQFLNAKNIAQAITKSLQSGIDCTNFNRCVEPLLESHSELEAFYVLDIHGKQISETALRTDINPFYLPAPAHYDHSSKEYFAITKESQSGEYLSRRYISQASGNLCKTYVHRVTISNKTHFICIDFTTDIKEI